MSFFSTLGKLLSFATSTSTASFISSSDEFPGSLADTALHDGSYKHGFLAFIRLVGIVYFKNHSSGFNTTSASVLLDVVRDAAAV